MTTPTQSTIPINHWEKIPNDIIFEIFSRLDIPTLLRASETCKKLSALAFSDHLWKSIVLGSSSIPSDTKPDATWYALYKSHAEALENLLNARFSKGEEISDICNWCPIGPRPRVFNSIILSQFTDLKTVKQWRGEGKPNSLFNSEKSSPNFITTCTSSSQFILCWDYKEKNPKYACFDITTKKTMPYEASLIASPSISNTQLDITRASLLPLKNRQGDCFTFKPSVFHLRLPRDLVVTNATTKEEVISFTKIHHPTSFQPNPQSSVYFVYYNTASKEVVIVDTDTWKETQRIDARRQHFANNPKLHVLKVGGDFFLAILGDRLSGWAKWNLEKGCFGKLTAHQSRSTLSFLYPLHLCGLKLAIEFSASWFNKSYYTVWNLKKGAPLASFSFEKTTPLIRIAENFIPFIKKNGEVAIFCPAYPLLYLLNLNGKEATQSIGTPVSKEKLEPPSFTEWYDREIHFLSFIVFCILCTVLVFDIQYVIKNINNNLNPLKQIWKAFKPN